MMTTVGKFYTPPQNQGQIVEVSYALGATSSADGRWMVIRRTYDQSDKSVLYAMSPSLVDDEGDYWNAAPRNKRWCKISAEQAREWLGGDA